MQILMALVGAGTVLALALALSRNRAAINWRTVGIALLLQLGIAAFVMLLPVGQVLLNGLVGAVQNVINYGDEGIRFVFGDFIRDQIGFTVAFQVLPVIIFFSCLMSTLYYLGIMQRVVQIFGGALHLLLGTSRTESMSAAANVFVGHTEAPLVVKPYLATMSESQLFAVMTGGCATIAGAVMAGYAAMGVDLKYLLTASFMAAPGGLLMAKIIMPETEDLHEDVLHGDVEEEERAVNVFEAMGNGALIGIQLALNIGAMLIAFVAMIALLNGIIGGVAGLAGFEGITLQWILGKVFAPLAFMLGVPWAEANAAGTLIGTKLVINEFIAYLDYVRIQDELSMRSQAIVTFALCGFANLSSIAMLLGGLGSIVPARRKDIARLGLLAVLAGMLSNLMSAVLAGLFVGGA